MLAESIYIELETSVDINCSLFCHIDAGKFIVSPKAKVTAERGICMNTSDPVLFLSFSLNDNAAVECCHSVGL